MKLVIVLCVFIGHVYSAPKPCIELCGQVADVNSKTSGSLQTYQTHSSLSDQNSLRDLHQSLIDQLQKTHQVNLESTRPGNWTEHNDYVTDNGAGSVHEERGQVVNGGSEVRYYKKNYESSYGSGASTANNGGASSLTSDHLNIHNRIDHTNAQTHEQPSYYDQQNSHSINHSSSSGLNDNLARLESFGEQTDTQIHDSSNSGFVSNNDDNWTRHNSFATDGGRGKVYEEEGQYHQGPTKVRYYKKNYTSSFSGGDGSGVAVVPIVTLPNINAHIDTQMNQMRSQLEQVNGHINQQTRHLSSNVDNINSNRGNVHVHNDYHSRNHINTNQNVPAVDHVAVTREEHHEKYSSSQNEHGINTHGNYEPIRVLPIQTQYVVPITHVESANAHRQVEKQIYVPASNINSQMNSHSSQQHQYQHQQRNNGDTTIRIPIYRRNDVIDIDGDASSLLQNQQLNINQNRHNGNYYNQRTERIHVQPQIERHVEQHWSASEHQSHSTLPQQIIFANPQGISDSQRLGMLGQQQYGSLQLGGYDNVNRAKSNNYISGSSSSYRQQYGTKSHRDNVHSETSQHGYLGAADCEDATHIDHNSQHGTRYRRGADYSQHNEDLNQHNDQTIAKLELGQQSESDNLQQTQGYHDHDQTNQHNRFDDYTQQHTGNLELDSQQSSHGLEDYTQQQSQSPNGHLEFGQETGHHGHHEPHDQYRHRNPHGHADQDSTQQSTHGFEDYSQQHTGNLELDQQHQSSHGQLEFGQETGHHGHHEPHDEYRHRNPHGHADRDSTQQSTHGQVESGEDRNHDHREPYDQYRHRNPHGHADRDSSQQSTHGFEDYSQQHTGNLELDQQHQSSHGQLEFEQETGHHSHHEPHDQYRHRDPHGHADQDSTQQTTHGFEDYTQQHAGNLGLDQQHTQQSQDFDQRNPHGFGELTQQQSGNLQVDAQHQNGGLEFGQQTEHHGYNHFGNHDMQQQSGSLEFGQQHDQQQSGTHNYEQQTHGNYYGSQVQPTEGLTQQSQRDQSVIKQSSRTVHYGRQLSDDLAHSIFIGNIGDFPQETFGNLVVGHQTHNNDDLSSLPAPKPVPRGQRIGYPERTDTEINPTSIQTGVKGGRRRVSGHQGQFNSHYSQPIVEPSEGVVSLEQQIRKDESVNVFQPRILEAYGGNGPYDANHNGNIYVDAKLNPSATLAPIVDGKDPWDVRETSTNDFFVKNGEAESIITERSIKLDQEYNNTFTTTVAPGFWKRIGHKITSTYEKAKDKVSDVFG